MNLTQLLELAFDAGYVYSSALANAPIHMPYAPDFSEWMEANNDQLIDIVKDIKYIHICTSKSNGYKKIQFSNTKDWPFAPKVVESAVGKFVNWEIIELNK